MIIKSIGKLPTKLEQEELKSKTQYFKDGKFKNINDLPLMIGKRSTMSPDRKPKVNIPVIENNLILQGETGGLKVYWFGHSSALIQLGDKNILIDPVLTKYSSPFDFIGVKRFSKVPIEPKKLPIIDVLLISHDHYDHLDYQTLIPVMDRINKVVTPLGVDSILKSWGFENDRVVSLNWWEKINIDGIKITATPAQHFSTRNPLHSNATWWCGFVVSDDKHTFYYSGDGGYCDTFNEIGDKFNIDLALMECGQYDEAWPYCHMFPEQTAQAAKDVKAKWTIPVHWGAFCLCNAAWNDSVRRVVKMAGELQINIATPKIGECVDYSHIDEYQDKWWLL